MIRRFTFNHETVRGRTIYRLFDMKTGSTVVSISTTEDGKGLSVRRKGVFVRIRAEEIWEMPKSAQGIRDVIRETARNELYIRLEGRLSNDEKKMIVDILNSL